MNVLELWHHMLERLMPPRQVTIQKVEIAITSNQEPSRIAREITRELSNMQRRRSPDVPDYSKPS